MVLWTQITALIAILSAAAMAEYGRMKGRGLNPRYNLGREAHLVDRQTGVCPQADSHTCLDTGFPNKCCSNQEYCIVDNSTGVCCHIASLCNNPCNADTYECLVTVTSSSTAVASSSCCPRSCTKTSQYLCPSAMGGQCCSYDSACAPNSQCVATSTSSSIAANSMTITGPSGTPSTGTSIPSSSSGLSSGAKAGIGAGVAVGALVVVSALLWFFLVHRKRAQKEASNPAMSQGSGSGTKRPSNGRSGSDYFGQTAAHGPFTEHDDATATSPGPYHRGVPASPQGPADITNPVEIDSRDFKGHSNVTTPGVFELGKDPPDTTVAPVEMPAEMP